MSTTTCYHPDPEINREVIADVADAERADLAAGYPPRRWRCVCGTEHSRGHFDAIGVHRCLACGYVGPEGVMLDDEETALQPGQVPSGHPDVGKPAGWGEHPRDCDCGDCP